MAGVERHSHPVEPAPPRACAIGEQAVHRRGEPRQREPFAERDRARLGPVDAYLPPRGARRVDLRAEPHIIERGANREAAITVFRCHLGQRRAAQTPAGCEQRQRFEHVGLARAILTHQQVEPPRPFERSLAMVAEAGERDAVERHASARTSGARTLPPAVKRPIPTVGEISRR